MLRIALPNKGSLSDAAIKLCREAGYKCRRGSKELLVIDEKNNIEFYFLRPKDIAVYVHDGVIDMGVTGRDLMVDSQVDLFEMLPLKFGASRFRFAVPNESTLSDASEFDGLRIACSYPHLVREYLEGKGVNAKVTKLDGAVEISIRLGVADAIADVVESGRTLKEAGLKVIGEPIMHSEAILVSKTEAILERDEAARLLQRLRGILVAREYVMIEYDVPKGSLDEACSITTGIESPTVSSLKDPEWFSVKAMISKKAVNEQMDSLGALGAKAIIITDIKTCRL